MEKYNQVEAHGLWNADVDFAVGKLEMLITVLNRIKSQAACNGLDDLDLPKKLDYFAKYELNELHEALEPIFDAVCTIYERDE